MGDSWATSGSDLHLELGGPRLRAGLAEALRDAMRTGRLVPGSRLPSSRSLAVDLGVARNTVANAYAELIAEGWLTAQQGSGTRVAQRTKPRRAGPTASRPQHRAAYSLLTGSPNLAQFPRREWLAAARRAITAAPHEAFALGDARGRVELRTALADYLARARGVYADPDRIVICSGYHHALGLIAQVLKGRRVRAVAVESYGLDVYREQLEKGGLRTPPLEVDADGARVADLADLPGVGAVLITPAHQFPTGVALPPARRAAVLDWARSTGGLVLEDDYDGEFRYDRAAVGALQSLDPDRIVYFGTVSKSLAPGMRLAWMVLPASLVPEVVAAKGYLDWLSSSLEQLTLAEFIASGSYDRHVRAMRLRYRRRRDQLVAALAPGFRVSGLAAGLQAVVDLPPGTEQSVIAAAAAQGLEISGISEFRYGSFPPEKDALVINYSAPLDTEWAGALETLCRVLA
ncbi:MocR-like pyridoxine biosynthesis transcription factor PdxR [Asanoa siamensis]|uniref:GntR family transcriptional regulator n=1 Tax=Asanoa siamensis TaxID=926357 RepID=A0ABQ4CPZ0_9ACTN|nr:PLP-dependent aminotransferase family protein [Asanoa siamensis]GIF73366.1 GntR family transcriptional regulator [Asanoa siamensis]